MCKTTNLRFQNVSKLFQKVLKKCKNHYVCNFECGAYHGK